MVCVSSEHMKVIAQNNLVCRYVYLVSVFVFLFVMVHRKREEIYVYCLPVIIHEKTIVL